MIFVGSDWHITLYHYANRREIRGDSYTALRRAGDAMIAIAATLPADEGCLLLLAGDNFDAVRARREDVEEFTTFVAKLQAGGIRVAFINGNHDRDASSYIALQSLGAPAEHINEKLITCDGTSIYGIDWCVRPELHAKMAAAPACDILALHAQTEHLIGYSGKAPDIKLDELPERFGNVVVGDIHITDVRELPHGKGYFCSPGPLYPCDMSQGGDRGFLIYNTRGESKGQWQFFKVPGREIVRLVIRDDATLEASRRDLEGLDLTGDKPLVEITFMSSMTKQVQDLIASFADVAHFFPKRSSSGITLDKNALERVRAESSAEVVEAAALLPAYVNAEVDPELYTLLALALQDEEVATGTQTLQEYLDALIQTVQS